MVSPGNVLLYRLLLTSFTSVDSKHTYFPDDSGAIHYVDLNEYIPTQTEILALQKLAETTTFYLYTRNNPNVGQKLVIGDPNSVKNSSWNRYHPTRLITHGWMGSSESPSCTLIRDAFLDAGDYNVILIDWQDTAIDINYGTVVNGIPYVAKRVSLLLDFLQDYEFLDPARTKIGGHSLGAHVAGLAARNTYNKIAEVIALDPAKPMFAFKGPGERVDKSDATVVQIIHTSTSILGLEKAIGTADFYPNGGKHQPGCSLLDFVGVCAHSRSYEYYAESITDPTGFRAQDVFMGGPSLDRNAQGEYTLQTSDKSPFALG